MTPKLISQSYQALQEKLGATLNQQPFMLVQSTNHGLLMLCNN